MNNNNKFIGIFLLIGLVGIIATGCGTESDKTEEIRISPITSKLQELSVDLDKNDGTCKAVPGDLISTVDTRVRLAVGLVGTSTKESGMKSGEVVGEKKRAKYEISGMIVKAPGGSLGIGTSSIALDLASGSTKNYDFNIGAPGAFDILCDGNKVGTFTATE